MGGLCLWFVIASEAKQSSFLGCNKKAGLLRRFAPRNDGGGTRTLERQPDVILGKRTRRRLRADEIVQLRLLDALAEFALVGEFVQHRGHPPGEAHRLPYPRQRLG